MNNYVQILDHLLFLRPKIIEYRAVGVKLTVRG